MSNKLKSMVKTVAAGGTAEALSSVHELCKSIEMKALNANAGLVYVGDSTVLASTTSGFELAADAVWIEENIYLDEIYIDAVTNDDGVGITYKI